MATTRDIATETIEVKNCKKHPHYTEYSTQTEPVSHHSRRNSQIKSQGIKATNPNKSHELDKCNKTLSVLKKGRCFACYYKYINSIEGRRQVGFITPGNGPIKIELPKFMEKIASTEPKGSRKGKFARKNPKPPCINPLKRSTVVRKENMDWGSSRLFQRISAEEFDAWTLHAKGQVFTETEISALLSFPPSRDYKRIRSKLECTLTALCDCLNINFGIDPHNKAKVRIYIQY